GRRLRPRGRRSGRRRWTGASSRWPPLAVWPTFPTLPGHRSFPG
ncbi:MAG: hypothetical protein AVDCRST_MAG33-1365, partial [uncultured Thermomicrobiales bacterium]